MYGCRVGSLICMGRLGRCRTLAAGDCAADMSGLPALSSWGGADSALGDRLAPAATHTPLSVWVKYLPC